MTKFKNAMQQNGGKVLYVFPFLLFVILLKLRNAESYSHFFELLPIFGRTLPYFCLTVLVTAVFIYRGGTLAEIGLCWPKNNKKMLQKCVSIFLWALAILALRIIIQIALQPILDSFPEHRSKTQMYLLQGNLGLLLTLLPIMWAIVVAEEVLMRGFFIHYLLKVFGNTGLAWMLAILISSLVFGLFHAGKGPAAMISSGFAGLAFGLGYFFRKNLWPVIIAHSAGNTLGFLGAYSGDDD